MKRIEWTGAARSVAFVFDFIGDDDPEDIEFPLYRAYEQKHPGKIQILTDFYYNDPELWKTDEVELSEEQLETLLVLIACVNEWHESEQHFFSAMNSHNVIKTKLSELEKTSSGELQEFRACRAWWQSNNNGAYMIEDLQDRTRDELGEDSYLYQLLEDRSVDQLFGVVFNFYVQGAPYNFQTLGFVDEDGEVDVPEEERESVTEFLATNQFLIDLVSCSRSYNDKKSRSHPIGLPLEISYTEIPIRYTDDGDEITVVLTCATCGQREYDRYPNVCPGCFWPVDYKLKD